VYFLYIYLQNFLNIPRIDDVESYRSDLRNDFLTSYGINHVVGILAGFIAQSLGIFSASIITVKHMVPNKGKESKPVEQEPEQGVLQQEEL